MTALKLQEERIDCSQKNLISIFSLGYTPFSELIIVVIIFTIAAALT
jgi:hypothetical protein